MYVCMYVEYSQKAFYSVVNKMNGLVSNGNSTAKGNPLNQFELAKITTNKYLYCHKQQTRCETVEWWDHMAANQLCE